VQCPDRVSARFSVRDVVHHVDIEVLWIRTSSLKLAGLPAVGLGPSGLIHRRPLTSIFARVDSLMS